MRAGALDEELHRLGRGHIRGGDGVLLGNGERRDPEYPFTVYVQWLTAGRKKVQVRAAPNQACSANLAHASG